MTRNSSLGQGFGSQETSRRTQLLGAIASVLTCFFLGVSWGAHHPRQEPHLAAESAYRERLIRWRRERMGHHPDVAVGTRLPLLGGPARDGSRRDLRRKTVLLFVGDAPG